MTDASTYTIFVNSTDSFEDTWEPFFHLLHDYWPSAGTVVLNTERKRFSHPTVPVACTQVAHDGEGRVPWGECMLRGLDHIPTEIFMYLQDDYFLYAPVKTDVVEEAARIMRAERLDCLRLHECGDAGPYEPTAYPWLMSVSRTAAYRISLQAGLWTKTGMRKYLRAHESPWQMEHWGSKRAAKVPGRIWAVSREVYGDDDPQVIPYVPTGIVQGGWRADAVKGLFASHGIEVPFEARGWWDPTPLSGASLVARRVSRLHRLPAYVWDMLRSLWPSA